MPRPTVAPQVYDAPLIILAARILRIDHASNVPVALEVAASDYNLGNLMQTKMIVFPNDDGFSVLIWGKWAEGSMRARRFDNRTTMIGLLETLRLISAQEARELEGFDLLDSCPLYSAEIDEDTLIAHGFSSAR